jgi:hypothetical protein
VSSRCAMWTGMCSNAKPRVSRPQRADRHVSGCPQAARQRNHRRHQHRDTEPLARAHHDLGVSGEQDVYVEKPALITSGKAGNRERVPQSDRIVQTGTQSRSSQGIRKRAAWLRKASGQDPSRRAFATSRASIGK